MTDSLNGNLSVTGRAVNPNTPQRTRRKAPTDLTGRRMQELQAQHAEELREREKEIGLAADQARAEREGTVVDYTSKPAPPVTDLELERQPVVVEEPNVRIRVNYPLPDMTYGRWVYQSDDPDHPLAAEREACEDRQIRANKDTDNFRPTHEECGAHDESYVGNLRTYAFEEGVEYRVPRDLALYLDNKGYVWH